MAWQNPVPGGSQTRGFAPASLGVDGPAYSDEFIRKAHDANNGPNGNGQGPFPGSTFYPRFHAALDIAAAEGTKVFAPEAGVVLDARWGAPGTWANGGGWYFRIAVNDDCMYLGAHCSRLLVSEGQHVRKGQHIANVGHTGIATGNHLHFWARLGPRPYYDPGAYYWNPSLVLPGGPMAGDSRFAPSVDHLPDTGTNGTFRADGDPAPMRFRSVDYERTLLKGKPIRKSASVNSDTWRTFRTRKELRMEGRIPKRDLPVSERQFGDVLITKVYVGNGHVFGYVKQVDLAGNQ